MQPYGLDNWILPSLDIEKELFADARAVLRTSRVLPGGLFHAEGEATIVRLLQEGPLPYETDVRIVGNEEKAAALLQANLLPSVKPLHFNRPRWKRIAGKTGVPTSEKNESPVSTLILSIATSRPCLPAAKNVQESICFQ